MALTRERKLKLQELFQRINRDCESIQLSKKNHISLGEKIEKETLERIRKSYLELNRKIEKYGLKQESSYYKCYEIVKKTIISSGLDPNQWNKPSRKLSIPDSPALIPKSEKDMKKIQPELPISLQELKIEDKEDKEDEVELYHLLNPRKRRDSLSNYFPPNPDDKPSESFFSRSPRHSIGSSGSSSSGGSSRASSRNPSPRVSVSENLFGGSPRHSAGSSRSPSPGGSPSIASRNLSPRVSGENMSSGSLYFSAGLSRSSSPGNSGSEPSSRNVVLSRSRKT